jgi:hypothetical protein
MKNNLINKIQLIYKKKLKEIKRFNFLKVNLKIFNII